jgi:hypothetical protein
MLSAVGLLCCHAAAFEGLRPILASARAVRGPNPIMHPPSDPLDTLLDRLRETPEPPPHLKKEVWRRIAVVESEAERSGLWARIEAAFAVPSFSVAFVAVCMLLGLFLAEVRLSRLHAERSVQLAQSYLRLIDPLIDESTVKLTSRRP